MKNGKICGENVAFTNDDEQTGPLCILCSPLDQSHPSLSPSSTTLPIPNPALLGPKIADSGRCRAWVRARKHRGLRRLPNPRKSQEKRGRGP